MNSAFDFQLSHPSGQLSSVVQGIWAASVSQTESVEKTLYADAGTGIAFSLAGDILVDDKLMPHGVVMLPINTRADRLTMKPGSALAGVRFHPAMGYKVLGRHYEQLTLLTPDQDQNYQLYDVHAELRQQTSTQQQVDILYKWAHRYLPVSPAPDSLEQALSFIHDAEALTELSDRTGLSQRQIERLFKARLGMTAKHYQRIIRIRKAIQFIQENKHISLAGVAQEFGFSDQAHMTREFKNIAKVTPGKL